MRDGKTIDILLAEDNHGDVDLTLEALEEAKIRNRVHVVGDGVEAMAFLRREGEFGDAPRPDLILLDLNMPRKGGLDVLTELETEPDLKRIPVVVLTTSDTEQDIVDAYARSVNAYIVKPVDFDQFFKVIRSLEDFWFTVVRLPGK